MNPLVEAYLKAHERVTGQKLLETFKRPVYVDPKPELPKINATTVKCRLTVCPRDCSISDLCIDNNDGHF